MGGFHEDLRALMASPVSVTVRERIREFREVFLADEDRWFSELCFCLLTANAKQRTAAAVQAELGARGLKDCREQELVECLLRNKHRFHNMKARWIVQAREHVPVRARVTGLLENDSPRRVRDALARSINGFGLKEASHFLRNVGVFDVAIIDRHILSVLKRYRLIRAIPQSLTPKKYWYIETKLQKIAMAHALSLGELDLYIWYMNTGAILK